MEQTSPGSGFAVLSSPSVRLLARGPNIIEAYLRLAGEKRYGSGFLVNIPFTKKYCIMTAGHNIVLPGKGKAERIIVVFPNELVFTAKAAELFVSSEYAASPTESEADDSSIYDYGLIAVDRSRVVNITSEKEIRGCALHVLPSRIQLPNTSGTVHGYVNGSTTQSKLTSSFIRPIQAKVFEYDKHTAAGVSGGPVFIDYRQRTVAVGIHNYNGRATRITLSVMVEMLSWIEDYRVDRTFEDYNRKGIYLQTTSGPAPSLVGRPSFLGQSPHAVFKFVPGFIAKESFKEPSKRSKQKNTDHEHSFVILSSRNQKSQSNTHLFVTIEGNDSDRYVTLKKGSAPQENNSFSLWGNSEIKKLALTANSKILLWVKPTDRVHCECGCITKDDAVVPTESSPTWFDIQGTKP
ncbi:hypothetical protein GQ44DRAFT_725944 [Phaeosphaeriaceae sp. PMI808]|nr:hypothetical protein GQ44DRAFT_725944 [Phaeosphaeriaceae sp. PMI808]